MSLENHEVRWPIRRILSILRIRSALLCPLALLFLLLILVLFDKVIFEGINKILSSLAAGLGRAAQLDLQLFLLLLLKFHLLLVELIDG
jgi:hypothetical protein